MYLQQDQGVRPGQAFIRCISDEQGPIDPCQSLVQQRDFSLARIPVQLASALVHLFLRHPDSQQATRHLFPLAYPHREADTCLSLSVEPGHHIQALTHPRVDLRPQKSKH